MTTRMISAFLLMCAVTLVAAPASVFAAGCSYGSTQARVQKDITDPWKQTLNISQGQSFNVGGFHDATGQFGHDVVLKVTGPGISDGWYFSNGQAVTPPSYGSYRLHVTTNGQSGAGCTETASIRVAKVTPPRAANVACAYGSTQARVQQGVTDPWNPSISIQKGQSVNFGSFHNHDGNFASDTVMSLHDSSGNKRRSLRNGQSITFKKAGTYQLRVKTKNSSGPGCEETAYITVQ